MVAPFYIIDSFTAEKFRGNPTPVCVVEAMPGPGVLEALARELNFPVTAIVEPGEPNRVSYFTVTGEIPACGHATLAAARVMTERTKNAVHTFLTTGNMHIETRGADGIIFMSYPKFGTVPFPVPPEMQESLGIKAVAWSGYCTELETLFIELEDPEQLRTLQPDFPGLLRSSDQVKEVVITSGADRAGYDYLLRSFCPWIGINEDPVTGSVHSVLAGFWKDRLLKTTLKAWQASERGGEIFINCAGEKVELGGRTVVLVKGEIYL